MHQGRGAFEGLHQVGLDGFAEDHRHGARYFNVFGSYWGAVFVVAHHDAAHAGS